MPQLTLHLTWSSRLWTFQLLGFEVFQVRLQKKNTSTLSKDVVNRFVPDGSVSEGKSAGKLPESEGTVVCLIKYVKKNYKAGHRPL
jgi:hypothetical protein